MFLKMKTVDFLENFVLCIFSVCNKKFLAVSIYIESISFACILDDFCLFAFEQYIVQYYYNVQCQRKTRIVLLMFAIYWSI